MKKSGISSKSPDFIYLFHYLQSRNAVNTTNVTFFTLWLIDVGNIKPPP